MTPTNSTQLEQTGGRTTDDLRRVLERLQGVDLSTASDTELAATVQQLRMSRLPLEGRRIVISGSAQVAYQTANDGCPLLGIGDAVAEGMLRAGASVVVNSHLPSIDANRLAYLRQYGQCEYLQADMSTEAGARALVQKAIELLGGLDVLVLNAGTYNEPDLEQITMADAERIYRLNVFGPMMAVSEFLRLVGPTAHRARIILTSSINAQLSETRHALYDSSKAALEGFVRAVSNDMAEKGLDVRINCVAPGLHYTPLTNQAIIENPTAHKVLNASIPLGIGSSADVVAPYIFLATPENNYMNGAVIDVSGGLRVSQLFLPRLMNEIEGGKR